MSTDIIVTVVMLAYNHKEWIRQAIEGVVKQETNFKFQLFVHDDCSTDGTTQIIREYAATHPEIVVPFYEVENQYSKKIKLTQTILLPYIKSKYVALCEGDDYWTDNHKLQLQVDYMESHNNCGLCFHNADVVDINGKPLKGFYTKTIWKDFDLDAKLRQPEGANFSTEDILRLDFTPTASMLYRTEVYNELKKYPKTLDLLTRLVSTDMGYAHYINRKMSAYRTGNSASASGILSSEERFYNGYYKLHCELLDCFDENTAHKYHDIIEKVKQRKEVDVYLASLNISKVKKSPVYNELKVGRIFALYAKKYFGCIFTALKFLRTEIYRIGANKAN